MAERGANKQVPFEEWQISGSNSKDDVVPKENEKQKKHTKSNKIKAHSHKSLQKHSKNLEKTPNKKLNTFNVKCQADNQTSYWQEELNQLNDLESSVNEKNLTELRSKTRKNEKSRTRIDEIEASDCQVTREGSKKRKLNNAGKRPKVEFNLPASEIENIPSDDKFGRQSLTNDIIMISDPLFGDKKHVEKEKQKLYKAFKRLNFEKLKKKLRKDNQMIKNKLETIRSKSVLCETVGFNENNGQAIENEKNTFNKNETKIKSDLADLQKTNNANLIPDSLSVRNAAAFFDCFPCFSGLREVCTPSKKCDCRDAGFQVPYGCCGGKSGCGNNIIFGSDRFGNESGGGNSFYVPGRGNGNSAKSKWEPSSNGYGFGGCGYGYGYGYGLDSGRPSNGFGYVANRPGLISNRDIYCSPARSSPFFSFSDSSSPFLKSNLPHPRLFRSSRSPASSRGGCSSRGFREECFPTRSISCRNTKDYSSREQPGSSFIDLYTRTLARAWKNLEDLLFDPAFRLMCNDSYNTYDRRTADYQNCDCQNPDCEYGPNIGSDGGAGSCPSGCSCGYGYNNNLPSSTGRLPKGDDFTGMYSDNEYNDDKELVFYDRLLNYLSSYHTGSNDQASSPALFRYLVDSCKFVNSLKRLSSLS
ncbi:hypothetical protein HELRODRAFT_170891 [Helobdella robusta]|uniref:Uncharacterized protein n=1 Tax=Helobdella robusta TaxID=6412 RepID=T1F3K3_HELRO|nr:hypothetical protein HELRODRAFT_170891 [Helobdella robusta]ESO06864.1 hypothetical protein HELRODRAFT_170891 [Helobdella robusta]